eukprot:EG_transcript_25381
MAAICFVCGRSGHQSNHCKGVAWKSLENIECLLCKKLGHDDLHCPVKHCLNCGRSNHFTAHCQESREANVLKLKWVPQGTYPEDLVQAFAEHGDITSVEWNSSLEWKLNFAHACGCHSASQSAQGGSAVPIQKQLIIEANARKKRQIESSDRSNVKKKRKRAQEDSGSSKKPRIPEDLSANKN